jgi:hypothetical protein
LRYLQDYFKDSTSNYFKQLLTLTNCENKTVLMAAAQAVNNRAQILDFVLTQMMSYDLPLDDIDVNKCNALDWLFIRGYEHDQESLELLKMLTKSDRCHLLPKTEEPPIVVVPPTLTPETAIA